MTMMMMVMMTMMMPTTTMIQSRFLCGLILARLAATEITHNIPSRPFCYYMKMVIIVLMYFCLYLWWEQWEFLVFQRIWFLSLSTLPQLVSTIDIGHPAPDYNDGNDDNWRKKLLCDYDQVNLTSDQHREEFWVSNFSRVPFIVNAPASWRGTQGETGDQAHSTLLKV